MSWLERFDELVILDARRHAVSLHYYPLEDFHAKPVGPPEGLEPSAHDYVPIAITNLMLLMAEVSFLVGGGMVGALIVFALIAAFNLWAFTGRS